MLRSVQGVETPLNGRPESNLNALLQRYGAFLDKIVTLDQVWRTEHRGSAILDEAAFEELKTRSVALLPLFHGTGAELQDALPALSAALDDLAPVLRRVMQESLSTADIQEQTRWTQVQNDLRNNAIVLCSLIAATSLLVIDFRRLYLFNRQSAQENRMASARLETVIGTSQDAIIVTDEAEEITSFNRAAEVMFGMASSVARGRPIRDLVYANDGSILSLSRAAAERSYKMQMIGRDAVGREFPVEISLGTAMKDGTHINVCFLSDISDRLEVERDLRTSRDRALAGERTRAHFLAVMSHEMRTPLTGILGVIELMQAEEPTDRNREYLEVLQSSGQILLGQINDVLDLTEIESMGINLTNQPFDLDALLKEVMTTLRPSANRQNSRLLLETLPRPLGWFRGDPIRLRQIMINLIGNAIKFTREGQILVEVTSGPDTQGLVLGRHRIEIQVSDTGTGIPQSELDGIFEDFVRAEQSTARLVEGTGLGLGIVKRLVAVMGGKLGADSVEGEGSMFWVSLSLHQVDKPVVIAPLAAPNDVARPASVLLIEDNATNRFILREMLNRDGHRVAEAADGPQGVAMADAQAFNLILMDINMPSMNGLQATAAIRTGGGKSAKARIVALTAHVFDHEHLRYKDAGIDDIVMKPLKWEGLRRVLQGKPAILLGNTPGDVAVNKGAEPPLVDKDILGLLLDTLGPGQFGHFLDQFLTEGQMAMTDIRQGLYEPRQVLRDRIHGFGGQAATFGARRLHSHLGALEDKVLTMSDAELRHIPRTIETLWTATCTEVEQFRNYLPRPPAAADVRPKGALRDANDPRRMI
ncbi:MAG: ATP-binding protein [Rhodobacterales bacterium]